jgi:small-conductance mechanosensitive channel
VGSVRGDVIDIGAFSTTVLEAGPGPSIHQRTGRTVTIPHSELVGTPIFNETAGHEYVLHVLEVPLATGDDWSRAEEVLLAAAREECAPFMAGATEHIEDLGESNKSASGGIDPKVYIRMTEPRKIRLLLRFPAPTRQRGNLEQAILRRFLSLYSFDDRRKATAVGQQRGHPRSPLLPNELQTSLGHSVPPGRIQLCSNYVRESSPGTAAPGTGDRYRRSKVFE